MKKTVKKTQKEKVLEQLLKAESMTVADEIRLWFSWRLSATVSDLIKEGVQIKSINEPHPGGYHARYILEDHDLGKSILEKIRNRRNKPKGH